MPHNTDRYVFQMEGNKDALESFDRNYLISKEVEKEVRKRFRVEWEEI